MTIGFNEALGVVGKQWKTIAPIAAAFLAVAFWVYGVDNGVRAGEAKNKEQDTILERIEKLSTKLDTRMDGIDMNVISIIGAILSAVGAAVAVRQAVKARKYRDEILRDRLKIVLIEVVGIAKKARAESRKIITPIGKPVRGVDQQQVINSIRDCLEKVKDNNHRFSVDGFPQSINQIEGFIDEFAKEPDESKRYKIGDQIYKNLGDVISCLIEEIDCQV